MQVYVARLFCLSRYDELKAWDEGVSMQKTLELEKKLKVASEQLAVREKEMLELKTDVEGLKGKLQKLDKEKTDLEARVVELAVEKKEAKTSKENHGYAMLEIGFERARNQAEFFYPDLKFDNMDPIKVVHNGALVDDDKVDEEGGGDHDPHDDAAA
ncbi:hypothetical protein PIB30_005000 [Stylosanthes scabra]|uniref:Uncharacterized protein n=1 Tax=Stylosanthes scabra TaxID=79078 RepID=A0ABU6Y5J3_9FABA|nr:hypothetical protein [Stylosanthes scabra]